MLSTNLTRTLHRFEAACANPIACWTCQQRPATFRQQRAGWGWAEAICEPCFRADAHRATVAHRVHGWRVGVLPCGTGGLTCGACEAANSTRHPDVADCEVCRRPFMTTDTDPSPDCDHRRPDLDHLAAL